MARGQGIVYMTDGLVRTGYLPEPKGPVLEERLTLLNSPEDDQRFSEFIAEKRFVPERLLLCLPRRRASMRYLIFPSQEEQEIRRMAGYELNALFPYKPDEFVSSHSVIEKLSGGYARVLLASVQRPVLLHHLDFIKRAGLRPDAVWLSTQALGNAFLARHGEGSLCLAHVEDGFVELLFFRAGKLVFDRAVSLNSACAFESAVTGEVVRSRGFSCDRLIVSGEFAAAAGQIEALSRELGCPVEPDPSLSVVRGLTEVPNVALDLLPAEFKADRISCSRRKNSAVLAAAVLINLVLLFNLFFVKQSAKREYLSYLSERIRQMEGQTVVLRKKLLRLQQYGSSAGSVSHKLALFGELASACPGDVLLRSLEITGREREGMLVFSGRAQGADSVLRLAAALKNSQMVTRSDVSYISKRPDSGGWVDFEIKAGY